MIRYLRLSLCFFMLLMACDTSTQPDPVPQGVGGVFILNEGAFGASNAEISLYDPSNGTVSGTLYAGANDGKVLGDIANSMLVSGGRLYVVVNNSGRIEVIDTKTYRSLGRITVPGLPRHIAVDASGQGYVTMQDSTVAIVNLSTFTYARSVTTGPFPEGILNAGGFVYVMNGGFGSGNTITVLEAASGSVVTTIKTPDGPAYGAIGPAGPNGRIFVVCTGYSDYADPSNDTPGAVIAIDPSSRQIVDSLVIDGHPGKFVIESGGRLLLLGPGSYPSTPVWELETSPELHVVTSSLVDGAFYGIGVLESTMEILLADAGTFTTNGRVLVYGYDGTLHRVLTSGIGIAPNSFAAVQQ